MRSRRAHAAAQFISVIVIALRLSGFAKPPVTSLDQLAQPGTMIAVGLIKATAVVGYIAVQDLTKMGDIVRSRTYKAFFPLIAVTAICFLLEGALGMLVRRIAVKLDSRRRKPEDILKGIKTDVQS